MADLAAGGGSRPLAGRAPSGRRTQAERAAESKAKLIEAAIEMLAVRGYAGTTLSEIGHAAGASRGLVTHYFGSKERCMQAVVVRIRQSVTEAIVGDGAVRGLVAIDRVIDMYLGPRRGAAAHYTRAMYVVMVEAVTSSPGLLGTVAENNAVIRAMIADWIKEAVADGEVSPLVDAEDVATMIEGAMRGIVLQYLADPAAVDLSRQSKLLRQSSRALLSQTSGGSDLQRPPRRRGRASSHR
jgi:AcrR family transcriptional regulator